MDQTDTSTAQDSQQGSGTGEEKKEHRPNLTRMGIPEDKYVRPSKIGRYTPTIHELDDLVLQDKVTKNENKILIYMKKNTIGFRNSEIRIQRKTLSEALNIPRGPLSKALASLIKKKYLLELEDKDHFYFYSLDPDTFDGLIVFRTKEESAHRMNRQYKSVALLDAYRKQKNTPKGNPEGHNLLPAWIQKVTSEVTNCYPKDESTVRNYSESQMTKYILTKYILLNRLSETRAQGVIEIFDQIRNPEYGMKQLVALIEKCPDDSRAITEELLRANRENTDAVTHKALFTDPLIYVILKWNQIKHMYNNLPHSVDKSEEVSAQRKKLAQLISEYPVEQNQPVAKIHPIREKRA